MLPVGAGLAVMKADDLVANDANPLVGAGEFVEAAADPKGAAEEAPPNGLDLMFRFPVCPKALPEAAADPVWGAPHGDARARPPAWPKAGAVAPAPGGVGEPKEGFPNVDVPGLVLDVLPHGDAWFPKAGVAEGAVTVLGAPKVDAGVVDPNTDVDGWPKAGRPVPSAEG